MPAIAKYKARNPRTAKMFDVIMINESRVIAITAGMESTAKIISEDSIKIKVRNNDVTKTFFFSFRKNFLPWYSEFRLKYLLINLIIEFFSRSILYSGAKAILYAA